MKPNIAFAIEPLEKCWDEFHALSKRHWDETESYRHQQKHNPSFERYNQYDKAGWFIMATARDAGRMVGYAGVYLTPSMHTQDIIATEDTWFLLPEYRKGLLAVRFFRFAEDECRKRGAVSANGTATCSNGAGKILEYLGYKEVSRQYYKQLLPMEDGLAEEGEKSNVLAKSSASA